MRDAGAEPSSPVAYYSFDRVAAEYEQTRYLPPDIATALAAVVTDGLPSSSWLLDAGVGTGRIARAVSARHSRTVGVDVSRTMMQRMRETAPPPYLAQADVRSLPFPDETFDGVLTVHLLHLIADWRQAVCEMWRVLSPGGRLFLAWENRERTRVREHFLALADVRHALSPTVGAHSSEVLALLRGELGAGSVEEYTETEALQWKREVSARETLSHLERRTYSLLWSTPEATLKSLIEETCRWTEMTFGSLDYQETVTTKIRLYTVHKR